jgi:WD40 repeat protein
MTGAAPGLKSPYPGLRPFEPEESDLFFGREPQIDELLRRLGRSRFVAVIGSSGSGKSSLVRAGLVPALISGFLTSAGSHWRVAMFRPGGDPIGALTEAVRGALREQAPQATGDRNLVEITLRRSSLGLVDAVRQARMPDGENLLIIADQFEELFRFERALGTREAHDEAAAVVKLLLEAVRQMETPVHVLITMRSDFLGDCSQFRDLPETINNGLYLVPRMTRDQFRQAITGPAAVCDAAVSPRLVQQLLNDLGNDPDQLPVLQHALMRAWNGWRNKPGNTQVIDREDYLATGGMAEALSRHADETWSELPASGRRLCRRMFQCLTEKGPDNREVRRPAKLGDIARILEADPDAVKDVIERFREEDRAFLMPSRLTALDEDSVIDISHESLIRKWDRLREWVEEEAQSRAIYVRLAQAARLNQRNEAGLWRNPELQRALDWKEQARPNAAWAERYAPGFAAAMDFLERSVADVEAERQREAEMLRREARAASLEKASRRVVALLAASLLVAGVFGWLLFDNSRLLKETIASRLATQAALLQSQKDAAVEESLLLALESMRRVPLRLSDEVARISLALLPRQIVRKECPAEVRAVAVSPDGRYVAWGCDNGSAGILRVADRVETSLRSHKDRVAAVAFSGDGKRVGTGGYDGIARVMETATGAEVCRLAHGGEVNALAFSRDGRYLATGSSDGTARVLDVRNGEEIARRAHGPTGGRAAESNRRERSNSDYRVVAVAFSPDGRQVATGSWDHTVRLMTVTGQPLWQADQSGNVYSLAFSRDGRFLATGSGDGTARVLDARKGRLLARLQHEQAVRSVSFSPDGRYLATGSSDHTARIMDAASGKEVARLKHQDGVNAVVFHADGLHVATASDDGTARVMEAATGREVSRVPHGNAVHALAVSENGGLLGTASADHSLRILDETTGTEIFRNAHARPISALAVASEGRYLALAEAGPSGGDSALRIVDPATGGELARIPHQELVNDVAASGDARYVAWGGASKVAHVVEAANGRPVGEFPQQEGINGIALSPDGRYLATAGDARTARVVEIQTRSEYVRVLHKQSVVAVAFSPDGRYLATGSADKTTAVVDLASRKELPRYTHQDQVNAVAFSPDSRYLAAGGADGMLRILEVAARREISRHSHPNGIYALAYSPDGRQVASLSQDSTVRVMDAATGREVSTITHADPVIAARFVSRNGGALWTFSGSALYQHPLRPQDLRDRACAQLTRNLTVEEWNQYIAGTTYRKTCANLP